jgi:hypothetical protein
MQTFLPYPSFERSARVLDPRRLGRQRVEVLQILRGIHFPDYGWRHHPAVSMWRGFDEALVAYGLTVVAVWREAGHRDATAARIAEFLAPSDAPRTQAELSALGCLPPWIGRRAFHRSHQSALVRKDPERYRRHFPNVPADLPYDWPDASPPPPGGCAGRRNEDLTPSGWVVRGVRVEGGVAVSVEALRGRRKQARVVEAFREAVSVGDAVLVPEGETLHLGRIAGRARPVGRGWVRPVRWRGTVARAALSWPAALQDPALVFVLRDEALLAGR